MKKIFLALVMLLSLGSTLWIEKASAAKVVFFNIRTDKDWEKFRDEVQKAKGQYWIDARLEADITTGYGIGLNSDTPYRGTFDGNGHTMTVNINRDDGKPCALFCYAGDATIRDLHLKGKINGGIHSAGLIGCRVGSPTFTIDRVWISTEITASSTHAAGVIGHVGAATVKMNDVRFDGHITTNNTDGSFIGSIIGWGGEGSWTFHRVYNYEGTGHKARIVGFCIDTGSGSWKYWGRNSKSSLTITSTTWSDWGTTYYNKKDQNEVVNLMNAEQAGSWRLFEGKAVPKMNKSAAVGSWNKLSGGATDGYVLQSGRYYVTENISFTNNSVGGNGLTIADGATVHIYLCNAKLTASGGNASGRTGAGAGIYLPKGSTLYIEGRGSVKATGGNAANGSNGSNGGNASADDSNCNWIHPGDGGAGGDGGGGAGAGIGTSGGNGGAGGGGVGRGTISSFAKSNFDGVEGSRGGDGETAKAMGNFFVASNISVSATGGEAGTSNGRPGGSGSYHLHNSTTYDHALGGGSGGGGGGFGGSAEKIGTGGPGGGGGGSGSSGTTRYGSKWISGWFSVGSKGGKGGKDGNEGKADNAGDTQYSGKRGWEDGDNRASGGEGGNHGGYSEDQRTRFEYTIQFNVSDKFNDPAEKTVTVTYKSNQNSANATVSIPTAYALDMTKSDKYLSSWYENQNGTGTARIALDEISIGQGTKNLYAVWKLYENLFADGHGSKSDPFIIREDQLIDLAEYVNGGGNTRNVYFKQDGNIQVPDILKNRNKGSQWTPIGQTRFFEGDYDGGGYLIRKATIDTNNADVVGIFGKVTGSIHNLGVEESTFKTTKDDSRGGAIAGLLLQYEIEQRVTGQVRDCYSANNNITATYAGGLVGEMNHNANMNHCLDIQNNLFGGNIGGLASQIDNSCQVDLCFSGGELCNNGYAQASNSVANIGSDRLKSGEITWLLNDKTAFGVAWHQNLAGHTPVNAYPVLNKECERVFFYNGNYTNSPGGTLFALTGQGLKDNPFLINNVSELQMLADYCNKGNNTNAIYFLQTADFDLNGKGLTIVGDDAGMSLESGPHEWWNHPDTDPRGESAHVFGGIYDGGGHTIRNGNISSNFILGIFGTVTGTVTRLCVENTTFKANKDHARLGAIAGYLRGNGTISNCFVKGCSMNYNGKYGIAGGVVADLYDQSSVRSCLVLKNSLSASRTGSIISDSKSGTEISRCYTDGAALTSSNCYGNVEPTSIPKVSTESLKSGEICHKLNGGINHPDPKWFQNISAGSKLDDIPVLSEEHAIVTKNDGGHYTNDNFNLSRLGKGTKDDPYKIATPKDLQDLVMGIGTMKRSNFYIRQTADIDLKDSLFVPIGTCIDSFEGNYDGGGHVIKNLEIIGTNKDIKDYLGESVGLFNAISGVVENLGLENCKMTAARVTKRVGGLAGRLTGKGQLRNCFVKNSTIDCNSFEGCVVGALVGEQADQTVIETSYGYQNTIVGMNDGGKQYGYIVGHMGSNAKASKIFTDGPAFCADWQKGEKNIVSSENNVSEFRFNGGDICWLLSGSTNTSGSQNTNSLWRQTMRKDLTPVPDTSHKLIYRHPLNEQVMYTNSTDLPSTVWMTLDPNHSDQQAKGIEVFKADKDYFAPNFKFANYAESRPDYEFKGWNTQADGKGTFYPADYEMLPEQDDRFYAVWEMLIPIDANPAPVVILPKDTIYFKVYDHGGSKKAYGYDYKGKLTLRAPEDHVIVLSGTVATEELGSDGKPHDYLVVYDGGASSTRRLTNDHAKNGTGYKDVFFSSTEGEKEDIGKLMSTEDIMTLQFITDDEKNFDGLDLLVTVLPTDLGPVGQSTEKDPFEVETLKDLQDVDKYIRLTGNSKVYIKQTADIDLNGKAFTPLASSVSSFEGHYDGGGHVIRNGKISAPTYAGVFGVVTGTVTRLGVENMTINYEKRDGRSGGIAARLTGNGEISYCFVKGCTVTNNGIQGYEGQGVAGAIVSDMFDHAVIKNCFTLNNNVSATRAAHICSDTKSGTLIERCYTDGNYIYRESGATITDSNPNMTAEQFSSGEVCYLLNGEKSDSSVVWRQTIGTDNVPVLTDTHAIAYRYLRNDKPTFSNTAITTPQYYISSRQDFEKFIGKKGDIYLTQDIDLGGWGGCRLYGNFDGGGHTIIYKSPGNTRGLFSVICQGASVKHLRVEADIVTAIGCGGISYSTQGKISDCHFHGNIKKLPSLLNSVAGIVVTISGSASIDHCSATCTLTVLASNGNISSITKDMNKATNCTWVDPNDLTQYAAQRDSALEAQAEYPVYAKGILDATRPKIILGNDTIFVDDKHLTSLTINDGERFKCSSEVTVDQITYKRRGTNGAYEPWILPFDYTIDADMLSGGVEFYRFEKDSVGNIETKQINSSEIYQVAANEPLVFRSAKADEIAFQMKLKNGNATQPLTLKMPLNGVAASMASTKDIANVIATYDSISADKTVKDMMYLWNNDKNDFVLSDSTKGVGPFRYYLQYVEKSTGKIEKYEDTDWARKQSNSGGSQQAPQRRAELRAPLSTLTAEGWQPIFLDLFGSQEVTAEMLEDYDILGLWDLYDQKADNDQYAVSAIYVPVTAGIELPYGAPLLVRAKHADAKPLVTEQRAREIDALLTEIVEQTGEEEESVFDDLHYWCSTFAGRYDVWQMVMPESDRLLNEYGALVFDENNQNFYRLAPSDGFIMHPMSYCFTAYDAHTFENLPLANDRIEIVVYDYSEQSDPTGIEDVRGKRDDVRGKTDDAYNLSGQKVGNNYRGIIIKNGKKVVIK